MAAAATSSRRVGGASTEIMQLFHAPGTGNWLHVRGHRYAPQTVPSCTNFSLVDAAITVSSSAI